MILAPLFGDAPPERIAHIIANDWRRFVAAAYLRLGLRETWEAAAQEFDLLWQLWFRDRRDIEPLGEVLELLIERAYQCDPAEQTARMQVLSDILGGEFPGMSRARQRAEYRAWAKANPTEAQRRANQAWLDAYRADKR